MSTERVGTTVGKYTIDSVIGEGGMAVVFAATHRNKKRVGIKMLRAEVSTSADLKSRFLKEGYVANTVDHPGAVAVLDDDTTTDGIPYIVMELLQGAGVDAIWEATTPPKISLRPVLCIGAQLLDVLAAAHEKSVVHRDIKPQNLFVTRDGTLKVLDFGIARIREATGPVNATQTGMMIGTPAFMPPEQALGHSSEIDGQTDVWAAGATLFSLLAGVYVHEGKSGQEVAIRAATQPARSLASVAPDIDPRVIAIIDRALAFEKSARWPNAASMRDALEEVHVALFGMATSKEPLAALLRDGTSLGMARTMPATPASAPSSTPLANPNTTASPVSDPSRVAPATAPRRSRMPLAVGAGVAALIGVAAVFAMNRHTEVASSSVTSTPTHESSVATSANALAIAPEVTATSTASAVPSATPSAVHGALVVNAPRARASASAVQKNCTPPYTIDGSGKHVLKPECL